MQFESEIVTGLAGHPILSLLAEYAISIVTALAIIVVGLVATSFASRWVRKILLKAPAIDVTLATFLSNVVKYTLWILVIVTVLSQFGVKTTSIIAALGAIGLAVGLALQGTLANIAAGIMLLVLRPFRVGEYIEAGNISGTVKEIGLFTTELIRPDGLFVMSPNSQLWNTSILNYTRHPQRRFELVVGIGYDDDMAEARAILQSLAQAEERVLQDPPAVTFVRSLDESSVAVGLRVWTETANYLALSWELTELVKKRFDEAGITIPYPQREITQRLTEVKPKPAKKK